MFMLKKAILNMFGHMEFGRSIGAIATAFATENEELIKCPFIYFLQPARTKLVNTAALALLLAALLFAFGTLTSAM